MKSIFLAAFCLFFYARLMAQSKTNTDQNEVKVVGKTSIVPEGIQIRNGTVATKPGYKAVTLDGGKTIAIRRMSNNNQNETTLWVKCKCTNGDGDCLAEQSGDDLKCKNGSCNSCKMIVLIPTKNSHNAIRPTDIWKLLDIPPRQP